MPRRSMTKHALFPAAAASLGGVVFTAMFGLAVLDPFRFGWLVNSPGDWTQHFVGWIAFSHEPWGWPLGEIRRLAYPMGTSLVYTDSLPLFALPLKLLTPFWSQPFQFQGIWFLICVMLQALVGYLVVFVTTRDRWLALLAALVFSLWPPMYQRIGHDTLVAHWLLLAAIGGYVVERPSRAFWLFLGISLIAAAVHAYLLAMVLGLGAGRWGLHVWRVPSRSMFPTQGPRAQSIGKSIIGAMGAPIFLIAMLAAWGYALGYFVVPFGDTQGGGEGIRYYNMNANAFFNPQSTVWSTLINPLGLEGGGQYEGFQYLGIGILFCLISAVSCRIFLDRREVRGRGEDTTWALGFVAFGALLLALSPQWTLGDRVLFDVSLPSGAEDLLATFRSLGRFGWVTGLILVVLAIRTLHASVPRSVAISIVAASGLLQAIDLSQVPGHIRSQVDPDPQAQKAFESVARRWPDRITSVRIFPPGDVSHRTMFKLAYGAALNDASINSMYLARYDWGEWREERVELKRAIMEKNWKRNTMYVLQRRNHLACYVAAGESAVLWDSEDLLVKNGGALSADPVLPFWSGRRLRWVPEADPIGISRSCGRECTFIVAVKDEASRNLPAKFRRQITGMGGKKISRLGHRDSYLAVIRDGKVRTELHKPDAPVMWSGALGGLNVAVASAGGQNGDYGRADISVNGIGCSPNARGLNMLYWYKSDEIVHMAHRDTFAE